MEKLNFMSKRVQYPRNVLKNSYKQIIQKGGLNTYCRYSLASLNGGCTCGGGRGSDPHSIFN